MDGLGRYMGVLDGRQIDVLPRLPIVMAFAARFIGSNYAAFASDHRVLVEANLRCAEHFGFDQVSTISDPYRETQGFGATIEYVEDGVPRCVAPPLAGSTDLGRLARPDPQRSERMLDRVRAIALYRDRVEGRYSIMGWVEGPAAEAADLRGVTRLLLDLARNRPFAEELMDLCVEVGVEFALAQLRAGADTIGIGDSIASQVSASMYEAVILPRERRLVEAIRAAGGRARLHICGDITHLLPGVARLAADIVDLDWQVDMREARRMLGPGTVLVGNLDPVSVVMEGTPAQIAEGVRGIYRDVGNPYMVAAGCEIPRDTPEANLLALCRPVAYAG